MHPVAVGLRPCWLLRPSSPRGHRPLATFPPPTQQQCADPACSRSSGFCTQLSPSCLLLRAHTSRRGPPG